MNPNYIYLSFSVDTFSILRRDGIVPTSGTRNYIHAKFEFNDSWEGIEPFAIFTRDKTVLQVPILEGKCQVPNEMLKDPGKFTVSVYAGDLRTSNTAAVTVSKSGYSEGLAQPVDPTQPGAAPVWTVEGKVPFIREAAGNFEYSTGDAIWKPLLSDAPQDGALYVRGDAQWFELEDGLPSGGTAGQVLAKASNEDYNVQWADPPEGGGVEDHSQLSNLDYSASGHTGFASDGDIASLKIAIDNSDLQLQAHKDDLRAHVTEAERTAWNGKVDPTDSRLTDNRAPTPHEHMPADITNGLIVAGDNTTVTRDAATGAYKVNAQAGGGGSGGGITEAQAVSAVERAQPDFVESTVTEAIFSNNLITTAIKGAGWLEYTKTFRHEPGYTENLSFPIDIKKGNFYELDFTCTAAKPDDGITIIFAESPTDTTGQYIRSGIHYSTVFVVQAKEDYSYINIIPHSDWATHTSDPVGQFNFTVVRESSTVNSASLSIKGVPAIVKATNIIMGGGRAVTTGKHNIGAGDKVFRHNTKGSLNIAFGKETMFYNTSGGQNVALGDWTLYYNTTGSQNTALGSNAMHNNVTGIWNTASGTFALEKNTTGHGNTATGQEALRRNKTGSNNTVSGVSALSYNHDGYRNVAVGSKAGMWLAGGYDVQNTANESIFVGASTYGSAEDDQTNQVVIGYGAVGNGSNTITLGNSEITHLFCNVTQITALSDSRIKEDVSPADLALCLDAVKSLPVTRYKYKDYVGEYRDKHVTGFMADDVEKVFPKSVSSRDKYFPVLDDGGNPVYEEIEDEDGTTRKAQKMFLLSDVKDITMTEAVPTLWGAVQALIAEVESLKNEVERLRQ